MPISQSTIAANCAGAPCAVHHVGELVVTVHQAGDEVERPVRTQPFGGDVESVDFAALDALEKGCPAVDLAFVKSVGASQIAQTLGLPVDLGQERDALRQLVGETCARLEVSIKRFRPSPLIQLHRRPAVDETHQVERASQNRGVGAHANSLGVRHVGAVECLDDPPLAQDALVAVRGSAGRWHPQDAAFLAAAQLVDHVLRPAGQEPRLERLTLARQRLAVHPIGKARNIEAAHARSRIRLSHRFPTSFSR